MPERDLMAAHKELRTQYFDLSQRMLVCEWRKDEAGFRENNHLRMLVVQARHRIQDQMNTHQLNQIIKRR